TVALGVHQSIGMKGIVMYGSDEQKERFLPDLASGRRLAGFALTEPNAGSDAYHLESRAVRQPDGSWVLNGEKRWIGNGGRGSVFCVFARAELQDGSDSHVALIVEKGMKGFEAGEPYDKIGWMVAYLFGLESMSYLTTGLVDAGIDDYSVESAIAKVTGTEFVWYQANRALQLAGGLGYMRDQPYEQILRDIRIFPIFEGAND